MNRPIQFTVEVLEFKPTTYNIDTCRYMTWRSTLIGLEKEWLAQHCTDNGTVWDIESCWQWPGIQFNQYYIVAMNVHCLKLLLLLI